MTFVHGDVRYLQFTLSHTVLRLSSLIKYLLLFTK